VSHREQVRTVFQLASFFATSLAHYKSELELAMMRSVKQALDPQNLLNPGKVLLK
jgi:FAD/FMN-containing dehydrogenase